LNHTKPGVADRFVNDVKSVAQELIKNPGEKAEGKVRNTANTGRYFNVFFNVFTSK